MIARAVLAAACVLTWSAPALAQLPAVPNGVERLVARLQSAVQTGDRALLLSQLAADFPAPEAAFFADEILTPGVTRALVQERDRLALDGMPADTGYRLALEFFMEGGGRARIVTALVDVLRPEGSGPDSWRIAGAQGVSGVEGLYTLRLGATQFAARNLTLRAEDLTLTLESGSVFLVHSAEGVAGVVLSGRGTMRFAPAPATEQGQLRIFSGSGTLNASFDSAFVRLNPYEYEERIDTRQLVPVSLNQNDHRRAEQIFLRESTKSFGVDLSDVSRESWYLQTQRGDFLAEVRTRRHGTLTYSRIGAQAEDVTLFDRARRRTLALYQSADRLASRGRAFAEDLRDYDVLDYSIDASIFPDRGYLEGRVRMRLRIRTEGLSNLTLRLADALNITGIGTVEHGRLLHLRVRNQNSVLVSMPAALVRDSEITLIVQYSGNMPSQNVDTESVAVAAQLEVIPSFFVEPSFLLSNRAYWYPQNPIADYATATLRVSLPDGYNVIASGEVQPSAEVTLRDLLTRPTTGRVFVFTATEPLRYLALVVSRFVAAAETTVKLATGSQFRIAIETHARQQAQGRTMLPVAQDVVSYYASLVGDAPYGSATIALLEAELPGGHSPGYFAVVNTPLPGVPYTWRNDPAAFPDFPDFFLAHELAHQWWGQAVGWRTYHDQWISESFAQYFAALFARRTRGEQTFNSMLRQFRRWAMEESDEGPVSLGYRVGHIEGDQRLFRAIVYNKGAAVLHMLRQLLGDDAFFRGLRRFYTEEKFQRAGTEDVRLAFEAEAGRSLERFFERWIYNTELPQLRWGRTVGAGAVTVTFEQTSELLFDVPVTVTVTYADGRTEHTVVAVTDRRVEQQIPTSGIVRQVQVNRDNAALAEFEAIN